MSVSPSAISRHDANRALLNRYASEVWGKGNVDVIDEVMSHDVKVNVTLFGAPFSGRDEVKLKCRDFLASFPDLKTQPVTPIIAEGSYVCMRYKSEATHAGPAYQHLPAGLAPMQQDNTGEKIRFTGTTICKIENGKIVEELTEEAALDVCLQLGVVKAT